MSVAPKFYLLNWNVFFIYKFSFITICGYYLFLIFIKKTTAVSKINLILTTIKRRGFLIIAAFFTFSDRVELLLHILSFYTYQILRCSISKIVYFFLLPRLKIFFQLISLLFFAFLKNSPNISPKMNHISPGIKLILF